MVRFLPQVGFESEYTQATANHLPVWHRIRYDPTATGQYLLNSFSEGVSEIEQYLKNARKDMYVSTADTLVRTHAYRCPVPQRIKGRDNRAFNMLRNAGFREQGPAFFNHPLEWQIGDGEFYSADAYAGHGSVELGQAGEIFQIVSGDQYRKGQPYTAGIYTKSSFSGEVDKGTLTIEAAGWGWSSSEDYDFDLGTQGEWVRQEITIIPTGDIRYFKVTTAVQPVADVNVLVSAPMLSEGDSLQTWEPGPDQVLTDFRVYMEGPTGEAQSFIELQEVGHEFALFEDALPDRIVATPGITGDTVSDNYAPPAYEWTKEAWDCEFRVSGDFIEHYSVSVPTDVWHTYSVLDRYMDNEVNTGEYGYTTSEYDGYTRTLEALCVWRRRIYLLCKDSYGGDTYRVLKVLRWQGIENRLETVHEVRVGMDTGDVSYLGFVEGRMDQMAVVMDDDTEWTLQMYFDIFYVDQQHKQALLRHPYDGYTLTFAEL